MKADDLIRTYAYGMLFINLAVTLLNLTGIFPVSLQIAGLDVAQDMTTTMTSIAARFENASSSLDYLAISGFMVFMGAKIIIEFLIMIFTGVAAIMAMLGVPAVIYIPIVAVVDAVVIYDFGTKILRVS